MFLKYSHPMMNRITFCYFNHVKNTQNIFFKLISTTAPSYKRGTRLWREQNLDPKEVNLQDMINHAADSKVPPVGEGENVTYWNQYSYPDEKCHNKKSSRDQSLHSHRPNAINPSETSIMLFPGQGTQFVGMAKKLMQMPIVADMFETASKILEFDLADACLNGPSEMLSQTQIQQSAILVSSLAAVEKLRLDDPSVLENCVAAAGFSVGEITALTFAGAFSFEDAVQLIKVRSEAMQVASEMYPGGMMTAYIAADSRLAFGCAVAKEFCQKRGVVQSDCRIASYLHPNLKVIAGSEEALAWLQENMSEFKIRKLKRLNVSGAFHTELMQPAVEPMRQMLKHMTINKPLIPVHSNFNGKIYRDENHIRKILPKQLSSPVKWEQTLHVLYDRDNDKNYPRTYECGPGSSLKTILKMVNKKADDMTINVYA